MVTKITPEQVKFFNNNGYLRINNLLSTERIIDPIIEEYSEVLDRLAAKLYRENKIADEYQNLPFGERVTRIYEESDEVYNQYFDFSLPQSGIKADTPFWAGEAVFNAITAPELLDAVENFVGGEIYSNPVQHVRVKVPEARAPRDDKGRVKFGATPWHQDNGVINEEADESDILTVWFPLMDTDEENGCLQAVPGSHKGLLRQHCPGTGDAIGVQIPEKLVESERAVPLPIEKGGVLFLHKKTVHSALPNVSNRIRWSFDLRYQPIGQPTGRAAFPGFVARSRANPRSEQHSPTQWHEMWQHARDSLANGEQPTFNRWSFDDVACA